MVPVLQNFQPDPAPAEGGPLFNSSPQAHKTTLCQASFHERWKSEGRLFILPPGRVLS
jgi:hypothetical protein